MAKNVRLPPSPKVTNGRNKEAPNAVAAASATMVAALGFSPSPHVALPGFVVLVVSDKLLVVIGVQTTQTTPTFQLGVALKRLVLVFIVIAVFVDIVAVLVIVSILAITVFGEPINPVRLLSFGLIWLSLAIYSADSFARRGRAMG